MKRSHAHTLFASAIAFLGLERQASAIEPECVDEWPNPDSCFPDVLCIEYQDYWDLRRSVVHISGPDVLATGVLINNHECYLDGNKCGVPYVLTANHVFSGYDGQAMSDGEVNDAQENTAFTFGFEAAVCGGQTGEGAVAVYGSTVVAASPEKDLVLLRLSTYLPPELGAFFAGWNEGPFDKGVSISHPCGAPKRIAVSDYGVISESELDKRHVVDVVSWEVGANARGSSGGPLFEIPGESLKGILSESIGAGAYTCFDPSLKAIDRFISMTSILDFLPSSLDGNLLYVSSFDSNEGGPLDGTVTNSGYYGDGDQVEITSSHEVLLVDGFYASAGSDVVVRIVE